MKTGKSPDHPITRSPFDSHPDRVKWNDRFSNPKGFWTLGPSGLLKRVLAEGIPEGQVLELACGISGNALALARADRDVLAVDVSDVALEQVYKEAEKQATASHLTCIQADLNTWRPPVSQTYALIICVMYWEEAVFDYALKAVADDGLIAWQGFSLDQLRYRPSQKAAWCFKAGEPAARMPETFTVLYEEDIDDGHRAIRRMIARKMVT
ncbi:MAG: class I SAM-dependent methyltransferase [Candidatus Latescibacteria bacterium]|nr:class I SAM-dependent methyltransferase [Candidatus Latescibacterota bacterium]